MGLFKVTYQKIRSGLTRTRGQFVGSLRSVIAGKQLSLQLLDDLERQLIQSDVGVKTAIELRKDIQAGWERQELDTGDEALEFLKDQLAAYWPDEDRQLHFATDGQGPTVILVAGINGAGKTTSIAKIAKSLRDDGRTVLLAACDTFRAAAVEQLAIWAERLGVELVRGQSGGDPAAVAFSRKPLPGA